MKIGIAAYRYDIGLNLIVLMPHMLARKLIGRKRVPRMLRNRPFSAAEPKC